MSNLQLINAILYVKETGCRWRELPETDENWHTLYVLRKRWSKNGGLGKVFPALQTEGIIPINVEVVCFDSMTYSFLRVSSVDPTHMQHHRS